MLTVVQNVAKRRQVQRASGADVNIAKISRERPVLISGPTASGKSALAMEIASRDGRLIVNADALQVYDTWRILSARPSAQDELDLPHALFGHIGRDQLYSTGHWLREVSALLTRPVVIVGGTGLNFSVLTEGLADIPMVPQWVRAQANAIMASLGLGALLNELDAKTLAKIDKANPARVQRAWEVLRATGRGIADWQAETGTATLPISACDALVLTMDVAQLDGRIAQRFDAMLRAGALEEARAALPHWPDPAKGQTEPWTKAIGAPELIGHLRGQSSLTEATTAAILASRQYAKRQRSWFRNRMKNWTICNL